MTIVHFYPVSNYICSKYSDFLYTWSFKFDSSLSQLGNGYSIFFSPEWWLLVYFMIQTIVLILHASKVMLKILHVRLQQYMNWELPDVQARFRKCRGTRDQIPNICWLIETASKYQKNIYFCFTDYAKAFDCVGHSKLENS